jgi:transcriptional regulator with XRE-family HTH domain
MRAMEKSVFTPEYAILCAELVRVRTDAGLTQRGLAKRLKVPHSWVAKVEAGDRRIDLVEMLWIYSACEVESLTSLKRILKSLSGMNRRRRKG